MTNREIVRTYYRKAHSCKIAAHLVHIRTGSAKDATIEWGWTFKSAWAHAARKLDTRAKKRNKRAKNAHKTPLIVGHDWRFDLDRLRAEIA